MVQAIFDGNQLKTASVISILLITFLPLLVLKMPIL